MRDKVQNWQLTDSTLGNTIVMRKVCRDYFDLDHFDNQVAIKLIVEFFFFHNFKSVRKLVHSTYVAFNKKDLTENSTS